MKRDIIKQIKDSNLTIEQIRDQLENLESAYISSSTIKRAINGVPADSFDHLRKTILGIIEKAKNPKTPKTPKTKGEKSDWISSGVSSEGKSRIGFLVAYHPQGKPPFILFC